MSGLFLNIIRQNSLQLCFQLLSCGWLFWIGIKHKSNFFPRLFAGIALQFAFSVVWYSCIEWILPFTGTSLIPYVFLYIGYATFILFPTFFAFHTTPREALFVMTSGYAVQHIIFTCSKILLYVLHLPYATDSIGLYFFSRYLLFFLGGLLVEYFLIRHLRKPGDILNGDERISLLSVLVMFIAIGVSVYWSYPEAYQGSLLVEVICPIYGCLSCLFILFMCFGIFEENSIKREKAIMEELLQMADAQQKSSKEAIDIINIKCHDLKHQISALEKMEDHEARSEYLAEIKSAVNIYDATFHTGCNSLDYVLREKSLLLRENNIDFDCIADGTAINHLTSADIYALMGNALDNAFEAVMQEREDERFISLQIKRQNKMALLHIESRCSKELTFQNNLPVTTKSDHSQHGFGTRSIRYIAQKYHGSARTSLHDGVFQLDILLPTYSV